MRRPRRETAVVVGLILLVIAVHNVVLWNHFLAGVYGYHDLILITDWFSNAIHQGHPFWMTDEQRNHLAVHWTPTIALWIPFFALSDSTYLLLFLSTLAIGLALWVTHRLWWWLSAAVLRSEGLRLTLSCGLLLFLAANPFVKEVQDSAHFEFFYLPLCLLLFGSLLTSDRPRRSLVLALLCLGVREEAGIYLAAQLVGLLFLPRDIRAGNPRLTRRVFALAALSLAWVVLIVKGINPYLFGVVENHVDRGWGSWGSTWTQVVFAMATSPAKLLAAIARSAVVDLNASFLFLPWLHPGFALLANAPGTLLFAADRQDAYRLWWYHASFLLPGFFFGTVLGLRRVIVWASRLVERGTVSPRTAKVAATAAALAILAGTVTRWTVTPEGPAGYALHDTSRGRQIAEVTDRWTRACPGALWVATDFRAIVHVPGSRHRLLLRSLDRAQLVILFRDALPLLSGSETSEALYGRLANDPDFALLEEGPIHRVYLRRGVRCEPAPVQLGRRVARAAGVG